MRELIPWIQFRFRHHPWAWIESILITAFVLSMAFYIHAADPFFLHAAFPWLWFAPLLMALRYGLGPGLVSALMISMTFIFMQPLAALATMQYRMYLLGGFILTLLSGEFSAAWSLRLSRAEQVKDYAEQRLDNISKAYYLTRYSHEHLEQSLVAKPISLRAAVIACRELLRDSDGILTETIADRLLNLLAHYCHLERASLYRQHETQLQTMPTASLGNRHQLKVKDELVTRALTDLQTTYIAINEIKDPSKTTYLIAAPMVTSQNQLIGILVVEQLPFLALHEETLETLTIILSYFSNEIIAAQRGKKLLSQFPSMPLDFAAEMYRLAYIKKRHKLDSALIGINLKPDPQRHEIISKLLSQKRGLDYMWEYHHENQVVLFVFMPFAQRSMVEGYIARIDQWFEKNYHMALEIGIYQINYQQLVDHEPLKLIEQMVDHATT